MVGRWLTKRAKAKVVASTVAASAVEAMSVADRVAVWAAAMVMAAVAAVVDHMRRTNAHRDRRKPLASSQ